MRPSPWRRLREGRLIAAATALTCAIAVTPSFGQSAPPACVLPDDEAEWLQQALNTWERVAGRFLQLDPDPLPRIVLFDARCVWQLGGERPIAGGPQHTDPRELTYHGRRIQAVGAPHDGQVPIPSGETVPAQLMTFASVDEAEGRPFLVAALPSIWRADERHEETADLEALITAVFVHEATHTRQLNAFGTRPTPLEDDPAIGGELDDDLVQRRFGDRPGYRAAYEKERDLLYAAVHAEDQAERRRLAAEAVNAARERRAQFFTGRDAIFREVEDVFLLMEGTANWAALRALTDTPADGLTADSSGAVARMRRGGRFWTQDEGLAIFLLLEMLAPDWQERVFGPSPPSVFDLLDEAVRSELSPERPAEP